MLLRDTFNFSISIECYSRSTSLELRNFITAREMIIDGNWLLNNHEWTFLDIEKPPLPSWNLLALFGIYILEMGK